MSECTPLPPASQTATETWLRHAREYIAAGWGVIPLHSLTTGGGCTCGNESCTSRGKHPQWGGWQNRAIRVDDWQLTALAARSPLPNLGVVCGPESGIFCLDIDAGAGGFASLADLTREYGELPATIEAATGGGGRHLIFQHPSETLTNRARIHPGIDIRAAGGQFVAAPSRHASGGVYRWRDGHAPGEMAPAAAPEWLLTLIRQAAPAEAKPARKSAAPSRNGHSDRAATALGKAAEAYVARWAGETEGGRNSAAFRGAGHLAAFVTDDGVKLSEGEILDAVRGWNSRNSPPLDDAELAQAVHSAVSSSTPREPHVVEVPRPLFLNSDGTISKAAPGGASADAGDAEELADDCWTLSGAYIADQLTRDGHAIARSYREEMFLWDGRRYAPVVSGDFQKRLLVWLGERVAKVTPRKAADVAATVAARLLVPASTATPAWLEETGAPRPGDLLTFENGILDVEEFVRTGDVKLREHSPGWFCTHALPYPIEPGAQCPNWLGFLDSIFEGDSERIELLATWYGYCLTPDTRHHAIMLLTGPKRAGKGIICRMLKRIAGEFNCVSPRLSTLGGPFGLWGLVDKTLAVCADAHLGKGDAALGALEVLKSVSGEDGIEVHRKNLPSLQDVRLRVRFTLATNSLPKFPDAAATLLSRLLLIPFRISWAGREDRELEGRICTELPGVAWWALQGLRRLRARGRFVQCTEGEEILEDFGRLTSPVSAFLADHCVVNGACSVERDRLYRHWVTFCQNTGHLPGSRETLGADLHALIPRLTTQSRRRPEGGRCRYYVGIGLNEDELPRQDGSGGTGGTCSSYLHASDQ